MPQTKRLKYLTWDNRKFQSELEDLTLQPGGMGWNNPGFKHYREDGTYSHSDNRVGYLTGDGTKWSSKCRAHSRFQGGADFEFEHYKEHHGDMHHKDGTIVFRGWDGKTYKVWLTRIPTGTQPPVPLEFQIEEVT